jgi:hypothetical protein
VVRASLSPTTDADGHDGNSQSRSTAFDAACLWRIPHCSEKQRITRLVGCANARSHNHSSAHFADERWHRVSAQAAELLTVERFQEIVLELLTRGDAHALVLAGRMVVSRHDLEQELVLRVRRALLAAEGTAELKEDDADALRWLTERLRQRPEAVDLQR